MMRVVQAKGWCLIAAFASLLVAACSSTGFSTKANVEAPRVIRPPVNVHPEVAPYLPRFVELLQQKGFVVGNTDNQKALKLRLEFNPNPFNLRVSAALWQNGVPILTASATNSGWGTALARGAAVNSLADSTAATFESELASLSSRLTILPEQ
jgi:hypothetical protein